MRVIDFKDENYPQNLKRLGNPPIRLYVQGNINILNQNCIAVIGTRECSEYGRKWCEKFVKELLEYDLVIISGMAKGVDTIAHKTALKYGGKTIAVLPSGFNNIYPKENLKLYEQIISNNGLIISEYMPEVEPNSNRFLERNRIVSGLAIGTLVIEAEYRSGTSVTARMTREQGKIVFCIPGSLDNKKSIGTNKLIQKGAKLVTKVDDIIQNYNLQRKIKLNKEIETEVKDEILDVLSSEPIDFNELLKKSNLKINEFMAKITMLELEGYIKKLPGNRIIKNE